MNPDFMVIAECPNCERAHCVCKEKSMPVAKGEPSLTPRTDAVEEMFLGGRSLTWLDVAAKSCVVFKRMREMECELAETRDEHGYEQRRADGAVQELTEVYAKLGAAEARCAELIERCAKWCDAQADYWTSQEAPEVSQSWTVRCAGRVAAFMDAAEHLRAALNPKAAQEDKQPGVDVARHLAEGNCK